VIINIGIFKAKNIGGLEVKCSYFEKWIFMKTNTCVPFASPPFPLPGCTTGQADWDQSNELDTRPKSWKNKYREMTHDEQEVNASHYIGCYGQGLRNRSASRLEVETVENFQIIVTAATPRRPIHDIYLWATNGALDNR